MCLCDGTMLTKVKLRSFQKFMDSGYADVGGEEDGDEAKIMNG